MQLIKFPRIRFSQGSTPLEPMKNLSAHLGGPNLWVKRDDCTGLATGGNKTRKLEWLMAEALSQGADTVVTPGIAQSNHARQTVAAACKLGMASHLIFEDRTGYTCSQYKRSGNAFLDKLMGADLSEVPAGTDINEALAAVAAELRASGRKPYIVPDGGSSPVGALGYVSCAQELAQQAAGVGLDIDCVVHGTGSAGTQAGLVVGLQTDGPRVPVLGISVRQPRHAQEEKVFDLARQTADLLDMPGEIGREQIVVTSDYVGAGYGVPSPGTMEALQLFARHEGLLLDPVYSGKAAAGLIDLVRRGHFKRGQNIVFLHTGGTVALYSYTEGFAV
jgi:L-cysteate sulfo-lyase